MVRSDPKIFHYVVGLTFTGLFSLASMSGADQECDRAGIKARFDIGAFIADQKRRRGVSEHAPGLLDESEFWLAAAAALVLCVGAVINCIHGRALFGEKIEHAPIDGRESFERTDAAAHNRLITDYDYGAAQLVQRANTSGGSGQQLHAVDGGEVVTLDVDGAIAIEKDDRAGDAHAADDDAVRFSSR